MLDINKKHDCKRIFTTTYLVILHALLFGICYWDMNSSTDAITDFGTISSQLHVSSTSSSTTSRSNYSSDVAKVSPVAQKDMSNSDQMKFKVGIAVVVTPDKYLEKYSINLAMWNCYAAKHNYTFYWIKNPWKPQHCNNVNVLGKEAKLHFFFAKHCYVEYLLSNNIDIIDWLLVLDGDTSIINDNIKIESFIENNENSSIIFYKRGHEIAAGNYLVKNNENGRNYLKYWYGYYNVFQEPNRIYRNYDNGALHSMYLQHIINKLKNQFDHITSNTILIDHELNKLYTNYINLLRKSEICKLSEYDKLNWYNYHVAILYLNVLCYEVLCKFNNLPNNSYGYGDDRDNEFKDIIATMSSAAHLTKIGSVSNKIHHCRICEDLLSDTKILNDYNAFGQDSRIIYVDSSHSTYNTFFIHGSKDPKNEIYNITKFTHHQIMNNVCLFASNYFVSNELAISTKRKNLSLSTVSDVNIWRYNKDEMHHRIVSNIAIIIPALYQPGTTWKMLGRMLSNIIQLSTMLPSEIIISMSSFPCNDENKINAYNDMIESYKQKINFAVLINVYYHCQDMNAAQNRNYAVSMIKGNENITKYITMYDIDDWYSSKKIEILYNIFENSNMSQSMKQETILYHCFQSLDCRSNIDDYTNKKLSEMNEKILYKKCNYHLNNLANGNDNEMFRIDDINYNINDIFDKYYIKNSNNFNYGYNLSKFINENVSEKTSTKTYSNIYLLNLTKLMNTNMPIVCNNDNSHIDDNGYKYNYDYNCVFSNFCCRFILNVGYHNAHTTMHKSLWKKIPQLETDEFAKREDSDHNARLFLKGYQMIHIPLTLEYYCG